MHDYLSLRETALSYARLGLALFPVVSRGKKPLTTHGCNDATTDPGQIQKWWSKYPTANIGIATGKISGGLVVIDMDIDEDTGVIGYYSLLEWQKEHGSFPKSWLCFTGREGYHLYLHSDTEIQNRVGVMDGVDIRGDGGYVIAPPSVHANGRRYEWKYAPEDLPLADAGPPLNALLSIPGNNTDDHFQTPATIPEGERNTTLFKQACSMRARGDPEAAILAAIAATNQSICHPPLTQNEINGLVKSAMRYQPGPTRSVTVENGTIKPVKQHEPILAVTAAELDQMEIEPIEWLVKDLLPVGLSVLGAPSKYYKSYMALGLCLGICTSGRFLGHQCQKHACLYFDLESTKRRPKERIRQILNGKPAPDNLYIITGADDVGRIGDGFERQLIEQLTQHPEIKLVVIDVFQKIRPAAKRNQTGYDRDYDDLKVLKQVADQYDIGILLIHHTRKMRDTGDVFNELSGSVGIMGAVDAAWVITRESRDSDESTLHVTGRDMDNQSLQMRFNKQAFQWEYLGTAEEMAEAREMDEYKHSPIINTIRKLVEQNQGQWQGTVAEIKNAGKYFHQTIYDDVRQVGQKIRQFEGLLWAVDDIQIKDMKHMGKDRSRILAFQKIKKE